MPSLSLADSLQGLSVVSTHSDIYGPKSAVCFTEMPLYALIDYVKARNKSGYADRYGIAFRREELFEAGARPVIYGLTGEHKEISSCESLCGFRVLSECTGIGLHEQYRYVYTNLFPFSYKAGIPHITFNEETLNHVKIEIHNAGLVAKKAIEDYLKEHPDAQDGGLFGFAWVYTYELTEVTQTLLDFLSAHHECVFQR